jgi:hypothetical protein
MNAQDMTNPEARAAYYEQCWAIAAEAGNQARKENEKLREAIREAHEALEDWQLLWREVAGQVSGRTFADGRRLERVTNSALTKLQPFIDQ